MRGLRRFADIISWNIEHLHAQAENHEKISKLAELVRSFRCDFWGLQEVGDAALENLVETINSTGQTVYDYIVIEESGQQNGAIFRTDTTTVRKLEMPNGFFEEVLDVKMSNGKIKQKPVFLRKPLLLDVSVRQESNRQFDFRCAIVHLKSTDSSIKDKGNALRLAAARELTRWVAHDRHEGLERDYLVMGDMNAEQAQEGLQDFTSQNDLRLLSVGMQAKYGTNEALTRVASKRLLDHIVVTNDSVPLMPAVDEDEQIIIRSDTVIGDWIHQYSDHIPVAVRFVIGEDLD
jgi:endonuclease/exonuclease/phosphatase family metal-dependent hydrolase